MEKKSIKYMIGLMALSCACLTSCDDDKDLGGKMDEMITMSTITLAETQYDATSKKICLVKNQELQLSWSITPETTTNPNVLWTSSDESVATVTPDGKIIAKDKVGTTVIALTPEIGFGPEATIVTRTVEVMDEYVYMSAINITNTPAEAIAAGDEYQLVVASEPSTTTFKRYKWTSNHPEIATVDEKTGLVTGVGRGDVTITVTADDFNSNPVSASCQMSIKVVVPITGMTFTEDEELNQLGYGQEYQIKYSLEPVDATASLLTWSSDNPDVISVDKTGKLSIKTMTNGSATITASYGPVIQSKTVYVAEGRFCYSFADGMGAWALENGATSTSDGEKAIVQMGAGSKYRGDLALVKNNSGKTVVITPETYRYVALKIRPLSALESGNNSVGCIKFEIYDNPLTIGYNYLGDKGNANNSFSILNRTQVSTTEPNILYFDLMSKFDTKNPDVRTKFDLVQFKFVIADYVAPAVSYDLYWVRTFKTLEELQAFVDNETNE